MSIKVAIRVRPLAQREIELGCKVCVSMSNGKTVIRGKDGKPKDFTFDHSFWSCDGYEELTGGLLIPKNIQGGQYCDQPYVYSKVGKEILENAWAGYHCCLFAYGQTGSGKSYSIFGYGPNKGIVPMYAEEMFDRIAAEKKESSITYEVSFSMMEIYNEKIQDLLAPNKKTEGTLKIRENKTMGTYVEDLSKWPV
jgi:hypothetical protein